MHRNGNRIARAIKATAAPMERLLIGSIAAKMAKAEKISAGIVTIGTAQSNTSKDAFGSVVSREELSPRAGRG